MSNRYSVSNRFLLNGTWMVVAVCLSASCADVFPPEPDQDAGLVESDAEPNPPDQDTGTSGSGPIPIAPIDGALVSQNDSTIGCEHHPQRGYGFQIQFAWSPVAGDTVAGYQVFAKKQTAEYPIIDEWTVTEPSLTYSSCNSFVIDRNLDGWEWKVRVATDTGGFGPWSPTAQFAFAPCRHGDGTACWAPPLLRLPLGW